MALDLSIWKKVYFNVSSVAVPGAVTSLHYFQVWRSHFGALERTGSSNGLGKAQSSSFLALEWRSGLSEQRAVVSGAKMVLAVAILAEPHMVLLPVWYPGGVALCLLLAMPLFNMFFRGPPWYVPVIWGNASGSQREGHLGRCHTCGNLFRSRTFFVLSGFGESHLFQHQFYFIDAGVIILRFFFLQVALGKEIWRQHMK